MAPPSRGTGGNRDRSVARRLSRTAYGIEKDAPAFDVHVAAGTQPSELETLATEPWQGPVMSSFAGYLTAWQHDAMAEYSLLPSAGTLR